MELHNRGIALWIQAQEWGSFEEESREKLDNPAASLMDSSSNGSLKRARAPGFGSQVASCLVDGCDSDLSKCRDYHRRHKVCELHSKTPKVIIRGQEQRFCQQCSRFHSLAEFDDVKRSCRKRLDGHNRRRRKPQPDPLSLTAGRFLPSHQGTRFSPFSGPQMFPASALASCSWPGVVKVEDDTTSYNTPQLINFNERNLSFPGSTSSHFKGHIQFPFLQGTSAAHLGASICKPALNPNSTTGTGGNGNNARSSSSGLNRVVASERALSLLSSPPAENSEKGLSRMMQLVPSTSAQSLTTDLRYNRLGLGKPGNPGMDSESTGSGELHYHGIFQSEHAGLSANGQHQTPSFSWE